LNGGDTESRLALIVFDKDGTLIDFNFMWASWITELAARLERVAHTHLTEMLFRTMGYDAAQGRVLAGTPLAICSMQTLYDMTIDVVWRAGLERHKASEVVDAAWFVPDPVALARPLADLPKLFSAIHAHGLKIAVVTSDDRAPTSATLKALGIDSLTDTLVCADEGYANKPAPDMVLAACARLDIAPRQMIVVGDAAADLQAARAANAAQAVAVLSGLGAREDLAPLADSVFSSVEPFWADLKLQLTPLNAAVNA